MYLTGVQFLFASPIIVFAKMLVTGITGNGEAHMLEKPSE